jgi:hypothetical protein
VLLKVATNQNRVGGEGGGAHRVAGSAQNRFLIYRFHSPPELIHCRSVNPFRFVFYPPLLLLPSSLSTLPLPSHFRVPVKSRYDYINWLQPYRALAMSVFKTWQLLSRSTDSLHIGHSYNKVELIASVISWQ